MIEVINTGYNCYLCNLLCEIVGTSFYRVSEGKKHCVGEIIEGLLGANGIKNESVLGICIDYPGICDRRGRSMLYSIVVDNEDYLNNEDIDLLAERFPNAAMMVNNDSSIAAYASFRVSGPHISEVVIYLNMFECVGAGAILSNGQGEDIYEFPIEIGQLFMPAGDESQAGELETFEKRTNALEIFKKINTRGEKKPARHRLYDLCVFRHGALSAGLLALHWRVQGYGFLHGRHPRAGAGVHAGRPRADDLPAGLCQRGCGVLCAA